MAAELFALVWEATLAGSAALLLVLALRRPLRAWLGASAAYALWLCVPVVLLAVLLPRGEGAPVAMPVVWQMVAVAALPEPQAGGHWREWLFVTWLAGVFASAVAMGGRQRRFRHGLGALRRRDDGMYQSASATSGLPAVSGVLRPRILLPADFERRYTTQEQALVIAHERLHVRRGDLAANALAALLACLFWFNPLLRPALRRFRFDQELACDERVIAGHPQARRAYGEAMLKTQFDPLPLPLGCHWQARHPLKERIAMLNRPTPSPMQWIATTFVALGVSAVAGFAAWAAQPAQAGSPAAFAAMAGLRTPAPAYPREALRNGHSGRVIAVVDVDAEGRPVDVRIEHSEPAGVFDAVTIAAVREWRFKPAMENGRAVAGTVRVPVDFDSGMTAVAGSAAQELDPGFRWFRLDQDKVTEAVCDIMRVNTDDAAAPAYCGIRQEPAGQ